MYRVLFIALVFAGCGQLTPADVAPVPADGKVVPVMMDPHRPQPPPPTGPAFARVPRAP